MERTTLRRDHSLALAATGEEKERSADGDHSLALAATGEEKEAERGRGPLAGARGYG